MSAGRLAAVAIVLAVVGLALVAVGAWAGPVTLAVAALVSLVALAGTEEAR